jgi:release factor glutamine methyltransferase
VNLKNTIKFYLSEATLRFQKAGIESARIDAELLMRDVAGLDGISIITKNDMTLSADQESKWQNFVMRRLNQEPISYILQKKEFYKHTFFVNPSVLIPRPETELIVEKVLDWWKSQQFTSERVHILDLGCGSGCIGLSVISEIPKALLVGVDVSQKALEVARVNAENLGLLNRSSFVEASIDEVDAKGFLKVHDDKFRIVVSNPPYIAPDDPTVDEAVKKFEPSLALFAGPTGFERIEAWLSSAVQVLHRPGICIFEVGIHQSPRVKEVFQSHKIFHKIEVLKDLSGIERFVIGYT